MEAMWSLLGLEPTRDISAIKRAYASQTKLYHPEENLEMFLQLRNAYQTALAYAGGRTPENQRAVPPPRREDPSGVGEPLGWFLPEETPEHLPNPCRDHPAVRQFLELYTGPRRRDPKAWLDYFTSSPFLELTWNPQFTALLLEHTRRLERDYPPTREFLTWLYVAYQFTATRRTLLDAASGTERSEIQFQLYEGANFDGIDSILRIAARGPVPKRPNGNAQAILNSFSEYHHLVKLAERGIWDEQATGEYSHIVGRYVMAYISEKCEHRGAVDVERHPAGLRVFTHFFEEQTLPEELYRILWQRLDLKNALMGRAKVLYGRLRELVLERAPEVAGEAAENFRELNRAHLDYSVQRRGGDPEQERRRTDAFFSREDLQRALRSRRFVEENVLRAWTADWVHEDFLRRILSFYRSNPDAPCAAQAVARAEQSLRLQALRRRTQEDGDTPLPQAPDLASRPFFRHWLNTALYAARNPETGRPLWEYLEQELPYLPEWSRRFLDGGDGTPVPRRLSFSFDGRQAEIRFHLRYVEISLDGEPIRRPCLDWGTLRALTDPNQFFFLLPITLATYDRYAAVKAEILRRLPETAAPEETREDIASFLAGSVCRRPLPEPGGTPVPPEDVLPLEWFAEDAEVLYGCSWLAPDRTLLFFEQTFSGRRPVRDGIYEQVPDADAAAQLAGHLLEEAVSPAGIPLHLLTCLPETVSILPEAPGSPPQELRSPQPEILEQLLSRFSEGLLRRLEFSWSTTLPAQESPVYPPQRSLVFLKEPAGYACLYFDDRRAQSFALILQPDLYWRGEGSGFIPFRLDHLFRHNLHRSFSAIRRQLSTVFRQVSCPDGIELHAGQIWSYAVNVYHSRHKYNLDKQLLGGFPPERARSRLDAKFYLSVYPNLAVCKDAAGNLRPLRLGEMNRDRLQQILLQAMRGALQTLRLTWGTEPEQQTHLVLLQDQDRFLLALLRDRQRLAEFRVADERAYLDAEGSKYPRGVFLGRSVPAYLIFSDSAALRNPLELILAKMDRLELLEEQFGAFAPECPDSQRPYEVLRGELVEDL